MNNMMINHQERSALHGLPYLQQLLYLNGIRPYVDYKTGIVGIKRGISYQSLAEELYVEPHQGIQGGRPSKDQLRRALKALERTGLITIKSFDWRLILQCLLVTLDNSAQNKLATNPPRKPDTNPHQDNSEPVWDNADQNFKPATEQAPKAATPQKSVKDSICLYARFEKFWELYPQKSGKQKTQHEFQKLNPSEELLEQIIIALQQQIDAELILQTQGHWTPKWKYPANWLAQQCWEDEIDITITKEKNHAKRSTAHTTSQSYDPFWESCKGGADFTGFDETEEIDNIDNNVIDITTFRQTKKAHG